LTDTPLAFPLPSVVAAIALVAITIAVPASAMQPAADPPAVSASAEAGSDGSLAGSDQILDTETAVLDVAALGDMDSLVQSLLDARVIFVGESHDRYEDYLNQLAIIRGLHERDKDLAIGMEFFQQPFQPVLDAYIAGELSEAELLRRTEYFHRWRFDYRLYRPILRYAREHGIPLIALNIPAEITDKVGDGGLASLSAEEAAMIPADIDRSDAAYRAHIETVFSMHPKAADADFERFLDVQLLWDEGMAERAAEYLEAHPARTLVVLAGAGHVEYGRGIPQRVMRRVQVPSATIVSGRHRPLDPDLADYILYPRPIGLPASGLLGVMLDLESEGAGVGVQGFAANSGAEAAGVRQGDRIVRVGDEPIDGYADIRIALMDSRPGQKLPVEVIRRAAFLGSPQRLLLQVELH
jgi:uncharacterized iron-regulated protein